MTAAKGPFKIYLFYEEDDMPVIKSLVERLDWDGVEVHLSEFSLFEKANEELGDGSFWGERRGEIQDIDFVLFCLSKRFYERSLLNTKWQFVLDAAAGRTRGSMSILTLRLDECNVPEPLAQWHSVDLFNREGYEQMMLAMKFQADMEGIELEAHSSWKVKFAYPEPKSEVSIEKKLRLPFGRIILIFVVVVVFFYLVRMFNDASSTAQVEVLAENLTKSSQLIAANKTATNDTRILFVTQTAEYHAAISLTKTKAEFEANITPTVTVTPTFTATVVSVPVKIIGGGNVSMVLVPGGSFMMGNADVVDASPVAWVDLKPFYMDQFEVTNALYKKCEQVGVCQPPVISDSQTHANYYGSIEYANYPVMNVEWYMARAFCEWRDARLPTEAEWEKAARGTNSSNYPWGDEILCPFANFTAPEGVCIGDIQPVDKYEAGQSMYDVYNMSGNVAEWVGSLHLPYPYSTVDNRDNPTAIGPRVVRGGSWASSLDEVLAYRRIALDPGSYAVHGNDLGFRCARDAD